MLMLLTPKLETPLVSLAIVEGLSLCTCVGYATGPAVLVILAISIVIVSLFSVQNTYAPGLGVLVLDGTVTEDDRGRGSSCLSGSRRGPGLYASVCCLVGTASGLLSVNLEEGSMEDKVVVDVIDREGLGMIEGWVGSLGLTWWVERESACGDVADPGEVNDKPRG